MKDCKHLDALIARAFLFWGIPFNFTRNPYLREAFTFAASNSITGYQMSGYNKFREGLLAEERAHIDRLLRSTKSINCVYVEANGGGKNASKANGH
jgi:hypothetical protein